MRLHSGLIALGMALVFSAPCSAAQREGQMWRDVRDGFKRLEAKMDRLFDRFDAWIKAPPKSTLEDDVHDAGRSLEKAADNAAKKLKKLTR